VKAYAEAEGQIRTYQPVKPAKPKVSRVPKPYAGGEWSHARFFQFLRSGLRQMSQRWPPACRLVWLRQRRPSQSTNRKLKWEYSCSMCGKWQKKEGMAADHLIPCGSLKSWEDLPGFAERLFVEAPLLRILCAECHKVRHQPEDK
jgi:ribosomal protein L44E